MVCVLCREKLDTELAAGAASDVRQKLDTEPSTSATSDTKHAPLTRTRAVSSGLLERLDLLLHVTILPEAPVSGTSSHVSRSQSTSLGSSSGVGATPASIMVRSDTDVLKSGLTARSLSVPREHGSHDDSVLEVTRLQK